MRVELDVFSGRSNPSWELSDEEATAITELLVDLPTTTARMNEGRLGFRGFTLEIPAGGAESPAHVRVGFGKVAVEGEGGQETYFEDTRGVEQRLLDIAERRGYGDLLRF